MLQPVGNNFLKNVYFTDGKYFFTTGKNNPDGL